MTDALFGFDRSFLQQLERVSLLSRRRFPGPADGSRQSPRHGSSVEFADFRDYSEGDDFRRIDWNAFARLDRLFMRLYSAEDLTTVTLFLDHSASMETGDPSKLVVAARLAAALSYVALHNYDRVAVASWTDSIDEYLAPVSGRRLIPEVWRHIARVATATNTRTNFHALRDASRFRRGPGLAVVLSDILTDSDWRGGLQSLMAAGQDVSLVQILAPEELNPAVRGDWRLQDIESGATVEVTVSPKVLRRYREEMEAHTSEIRHFCRRNGVPYVQISSDSSLPETVFAGLRAARMIG